jgi:hypothetical protein
MNSIPARCRFLIGESHRVQSAQFFECLQRAPSRLIEDLRVIAWKSIDSFTSMPTEAADGGDSATAVRSNSVLAARVVANLATLAYLACGPNRVSVQK